MARTATKERISAGTTLACPTCGRRVTVALEAISVTCHNRHRTTPMRAVTTGR